MKLVQLSQSRQDKSSQTGRERQFQLSRVKSETFQVFPSILFFFFFFFFTSLGVWQQKVDFFFSVRGTPNG